MGIYHLQLVDIFMNSCFGSIELKIKNSEFNSLNLSLKEFGIRFSSSFVPSDLKFTEDVCEKTHKLQKWIIDGFKSQLETQNSLFYLDMALRNLSLIYSECLGLFKLSALPFEYRFFEELSGIYLKSEKDYLKLIPFETISADDIAYLFKKIISRSLNLESTELIIDIKESFLLQAERRCHLELEQYWPNVCQEVLPIIDFLPKSNMYHKLKKCFK